MNSLSLKKKEKKKIKPFIKEAKTDTNWNMVNT